MGSLKCSPKITSFKAIVGTLILFLVFTLVYIHRKSNTHQTEKSSNEVHFQQPDQLPWVTKPQKIKSIPGPAVALKLYLTLGQTLTFSPSKRDKIIYQPKPVVDSKITNYRLIDLKRLKAGIENVTSNVPPAFHKKTIQSIDAQKKNLRPDVKLFLQEWHEITRGSSETWRSLNDINYQLTVLQSKRDPPKPWTPNCDGCFKNEYKMIINSRACENKDIEVDIITVVTSVPKSVDTRRIIRESWAKWTRNNTSNFRVIFLFGIGWSNEENEILRYEALNFGDILQEDYPDGYYNLTQKVVSGFKWVLRTCPKFRFILRAAEDGFVFLPEVLNLIEKEGHTPQFQDYQMGKCFVGAKAKPFRCPDYKGYLSTEDFSWDLFPPYALGTSFIMSYKLVKRVVDKSKDVPFVPIEDSYFGIVLRTINSGCLNVAPFSPARDAVPDGEKIALYKKIVKKGSLWW